ncbi:MAG: hypothetical protein L7U72_13015 [Rubripirellula sp.]|nr:hypothetical protein [Rubripirellula sp.]
MKLRRLNLKRLNHFGFRTRPRTRKSLSGVRALAMFLFAVCLAMSPLLACKLPVFRYALERWPVDQYRFVALISHPDSPVVQDAILALKEKQTAAWNAEIEFVNLAELTEEQWWQYEGLEGGDQDRLQVYFPSKGQNKRLGWQGDLTRESVQRWASSPARKDLIHDLSQGVSAVWWLIEGRDLEKADQIEMEMKSILSQANREIKIPDGVISQADAADYFQSNPGASMDDVLRCSVPLRVDFRLRRISSDDVSELGTLAMLRALGVTDSRNAWLVPVFGRGRMLDAIPVDRVDSSVVMNACKYMVGECSCTVKSQNPGADLLLLMNWEKELGVESLVMGATSLLPPVLLSIPEGQKVLPSEQEMEKGTDQSTEQKTQHSIPAAISSGDALAQGSAGRHIDQSEDASAGGIGFPSRDVILLMLGLSFLTVTMLMKYRH